MNCWDILFDINDLVTNGTYMYVFFVLWIDVDNDIMNGMNVCYINWDL